MQHYTVIRESARSGSAMAGDWPGRGGALAILLVFFAAYAAIFVREEQHRLTDPVRMAERGEVDVASPHSLLRAEHVERVLRLVQAAAPAGSTLEQFRLRPTQITATVAHPDGRRMMMTINVGFELSQRRFGAVRGTGPTPDRIDAEVPSRLLARAEQRLGLQPKHFASLHLSSTSRGEANWHLRYDEPPLDNSAIAALDGSDLRLTGSPATRRPSPAQGARS